ncbi:MAG: GNAT family N-acetyltransferase [Bacteroidetes bacterium]|nr:GNAT family N-acetyltransferase [Bacteroidota bacterium]
MDYLLRPWKLDDLDSLVLHANNPRIAQFMTDAFPHPYTPDAGKKFIQYATKDHTVHIFAIEVKGKAVGGIGIHPQQDVFRKNAEIGYWLGEAYWNTGIMTQALSQIVTIAFINLNFERVFARPFSTNTASQKVLEKCGFKMEAILKKTIYKDGLYLDELIYAKRKKELSI